MKIWQQRLIWSSLWIWSIFLFNSLSVSAIPHFLLFLVIISYYTKIKIKKVWNSCSNSTRYLFLLFCWGLICTIVNYKNYPSTSEFWKNLFKLKYFLVGSLLPYLLAHYLEILGKEKSQLLLKKLGITLIVSTTVATISGLIGYYSGFNPLRWRAACHPDRACGMNGMYMTYGYGIGAYLVGVFPFTRFFPKANGLTFSFILNFVGFMASKARGAYVSFILSIPLFFLKKNLKVFFQVLSLLLGVLALNIFFNPTVKEIFFHPQRLESISIRLSLFQTALIAGVQNPLFGLGYKNFEPQVIAIKKLHSIAYQDFQGHAHNNFLEHFASMGFIGLILLLLFFYHWMKELYKNKDSSPFFPFSVYVFLSGFFQYTLGDASNMFLIMLVYSLSMVVKNEQ